MLGCHHLHPNLLAAEFLFASRFRGNDENTEVPADWIVGKTIQAYQCAPEACLADWACKPGHHGRVPCFL